MYNDISCVLGADTQTNKGDGRKFISFLTETSSFLLKTTFGSHWMIFWNILQVKLSLPDEKKIIIFPQFWEKGKYKGFKIVPWDSEYKGFNIVKGEMFCPLDLPLCTHTHTYYSKKIKNKLSSNVLHVEFIYLRVYV